MNPTLDKLKALKSYNQKLSIEVTESSGELPISSLQDILKPFAAIENVIDREIRKLSKSTDIPKRNNLSG